MQRAMPSVLRALCAYGLGIKPILPETEVLQEISFSLGTTHSVHELLGEALDHPMEISPLTAEELEALENLYRTTKDVRLRTRAQIVLLAGEQRMTASTIAAIVREVGQTVRNWLKRWMAEGIEGLKDRPMPGAPVKITEAYEEQL